MRLEHHLVGGYVRYISPYIIIILLILFVVKCLYNSFDVNISNYIQINTRHTDTIKFHHQSSRTDAFHYSLFIRFVEYGIVYL